MKERKTNQVTAQRQFIVAGCLTLILVTCLSGLYIGKKADRQEQDAQLARENEEISEEVQTEPLQAVDSVVLPEVSADEPQAEAVIEQREVSEDAAEPVLEQSEEPSAQPVGGSAVQIAQEAPVLSFAGELQWPVEGSVLMNYSMDSSVYFATLDQYKYNPAMIISAEPKDTVAAAAEGTITEIFEDAETGLTVKMDIGDGYELTYGQLQELNYKEGAHLDAGNVIGTVAKTSKYYSVEGDNLYFSMTKDGVPTDPTEYLPQ